MKGAKTAPARGRKYEGPSLTLPVKTLRAGDIIFSDEPVVMQAVIGSCVTVCLWTPRARAGGMCHFMLPRAYLGALPDPRVGTAAVELLIRTLKDFSGGDPILAKIFGGATMHELPETPSAYIGPKNVDVAWDILFRARIPIQDVEIGGVRGRKVLFHPHSGETWVREV